MKKGPQLTRRVAARVREWRERREFTKTYVARQCGVTVEAIVMIEQARRIPSLELATRLARTLGLTVDDLVTR